MKLFELSIASFVLRLILLMAIVIAAGFSGYWAVALLALPVFVSGMLGATFAMPRVNVRLPRVESPSLPKATEAAPSLHPA